MGFCRRIDPEEVEDDEPGLKSDVYAILWMRAKYPRRLKKILTAFEFLKSRRNTGEVYRAQRILC